MKLPDVLVAARSFIVLNLNPDYETIKFLAATHTSNIWEVKSVFKDKNLNLVYTVTLCISDITGEVTSFLTTSAT
jgi:hypothetical protein